ncbi:MAG: DUF2141 domain-containing protein [Chitinophagaceae bacterium]|nr:DUF2141 domain-containing protein [Chitinophagaceae bacterium]MBK8952900.1 DUF2141 domain-containing protein [Chitinophagaceae bacterium]
MRKIYIISFAFLLLTFLYSFNTPAEQGVKITINNARNEKGHVLVSLFKDGVGYPNNPEKAVKRVKLSIINKRAEVIFTNLPSGTYAVAILHDENDDLKMNKNLLGIPKEGFGFSNNAMGTFGPPSFSRASFQHTPGQLTVVTIRTKYF